MGADDSLLRLLYPHCVLPALPASYEHCALADGPRLLGRLTRLVRRAGTLPPPVTSRRCGLPRIYVLCCDSIY